MAVAGLAATVYLDHNVDPETADDLREHGYGAVAAQEVGMDQATDEEHLRFAAAAGRVLITHDLKDFPRLAQSWYERGEAHAGIVFCGQPPNVPYGEMLRGLLVLLNSRTAEEFADEVIWLRRVP
jgi:predicted nuclease of predicted toxin-antitoxin system